MSRLTVKPTLRGVRAQAGIYDDIGHLPLLRRRVKKLLVFDSAAIHNNRTDADHVRCAPPSPRAHAPTAAAVRAFGAAAPLPSSQSRT
jgi:hypothetical protein